MTELNELKLFSENKTTEKITESWMEYISRNGKNSVYFCAEKSLGAIYFPYKFVKENIISGKTSDNLNNNNKEVQSSQESWITYFKRKGTDPIYFCARKSNDSYTYAKQKSFDIYYYFFPGKTKSNDGGNDAKQKRFDILIFFSKK